MNRGTLASDVALDLGMAKADAKAAVDCVIDKIKLALLDGEDVGFAGFGTLMVVERAARAGRNPSTGEPVNIPAKKSIKFKPSKMLKDELNS